MILEQRGGDFYCDCPVGMKGKMCKRTVGMLYRDGIIEPTSDVRAVPLGGKRRKGRPKKLPSNCLAKSPVQPVDVALNIDEGDVPMNVEDDDSAGNENTAVVESPVQILQRQLRSGLGASKPPKKARKNASSCKTAVSSSSSVPSSSNPESVPIVKKPDPVRCRKRKGGCKHVIAFNEHYNASAWSKYAEYVKSLSSMTMINE